jgi:5-methylcytosine-specific restriction enzyme A
VRAGQLLTTAQRGYDARWKHFTAKFLERHPVCLGTGPIPDDWRAHERELRDGAPHVAACDREATETHHIRKLAQFPQLRLVESNCFPQSKVCHAVRTARGE